MLYNFVTVSNRIGWNNARVLWSLHSRLSHRVAEIHRAQAHTAKFWWNVYSYYCTWLLICKVYCKYISCIENIVKTSWETFSYNQVWRHRLCHIIVRNLSINTVLTSLSPELLLQKECFIFRPFVKIHGQLCKMSIFVKFEIIFSRFNKCPCKIYSHLLCLRFASNTQFMYIYELMMTELSQFVIIMESKYSEIGINTLACRLCSKWCQTFGGRCIFPNPNSNFMT